MDPEAVLGGLDDAQRSAVTSEATPLAVIAPAGSGKTKVLTARVAHRVAIGSAEPAHVLCVTFTRKAALELRSRLRRIGLHDRIEAGTFHGVALRLLRDRWAAAGRREPGLLTHARPFLREQVAPKATPAEIADLATEIAWARARLVGADAYVDAARRNGRRTRRSAEWTAAHYAAYEAAKSTRHVVDFDDLLAACTRAMAGDPAFAAAQRWRFRHLFVDEFQDVNPLQFELLEAWRGDRWDVFVVGDTHQSIYGWNGADPRLLDTLGARWPALQTIHLDRTHRSTPQVTRAAAAVVRAAGLPDRHPESTGSPGPAATLAAHDDEIVEANALATAIRRRRGPDAPWSAFAVLTRTHDQIVELERGFAAVGIPTAVRTTAATDTEDDVDAGPAEPIADERPDAVTLSTIHAAKGLEWPVVHVAGCEDGSIPHASARRKDARDEEARLLYVAITRAAREVHLHWARSRTIRGVRRERTRSPFLDGFEDAVAETLDEVASDRARHLASLRSIVRSSAPVDPLATALETWRERRARIARTTPEVVLDDLTLRAIVTRRPRTADELAAVPGLGVARASRYADELLRLVEETDARAAGTAG